VRVAGALAIGQLRDTTRRERLVTLLGDRDTAVAATAAFALGLLRDSAALAPLVGALSGPSSVAAEAAWALGELGAPARGAIDSLLSGAPFAPTTTGALLLSASKVRPLPVGAILRHVDARDTAVAWRAAYPLSRPRPQGEGRALPPAVVRSLAARSVTGDALTREQIARALARPAVPDSLVGVARRALDLLVVSREPHVRINAVRSLATYGDSLRLAVVAVTRDRDANVRIAAAQLLGQVMDRDLSRWAWLWDSDTSTTYRRAVIAGAVRVGVDLPGMREWRGSPDWRQRAAVAAAGSSAPTAARAGQLALPLLRDPDRRVRSAAYSVLAARSDSLPSLRDTIRAGLLDRDPVVRATAIGALARRATAADAPAVIAAYRRALADTLDDARVAAIAYLRSAWQRDSASFPDSLRAAVAALPAPFERSVVAAGRNLSPFAGWTMPPLGGRPIEWYEDIVRRPVVPALGGRLPVAHLVTGRGTIEIELFARDAPLTVANFLSLARDGYYRETLFHRVVPNFVAQDGDPRGDGNGGPGYAIRDEINRRRYGRGVVGMALSGPDTGGSQYFLTHSPQPHLDGGYTVFGRVTRGLEALDAIVEGDRITEVRVPGS
jgi:cyclophilin family peptidyl-prolyl cis-trans isomerase/HEAT repeat protein